MTVTRVSPTRTQSTTQARPVQRGDKGAAVRSLQQNLHKHGEGAKVGTVDGDFGPKTAAGLRSFQDKQLSQLQTRISSSSSDNQAIRLSQQANTLRAERDQGVAGPETQRLLARDPVAAPTPTPDLPDRAATTTVGGDPSVAAPPPQVSQAPPSLARGLTNPAEIDRQSGVRYDETAGAQNNAIDTAQRATVSRGSAGQDVRDVQTLLNQQGYDSGPVDGQFGPKTDAAVRRFQTDKNLAVDGIVGPHTWAALGAGQTPATTAAAPTTPAAPSSTPSALDVSRQRAEGLERDFRAAQEHEREPDLTTAKNNLGDHLENDLIPKLEARQTQLGQEIFRGVEHGQDVSGAQARYDANATELSEARALLDEARGNPINRNTGSGVLDPGAGFDPAHPPANYEARVTAPNGTSYDVNVSAAAETSLGPNGESAVTLEISRSEALGLNGGAEIGVGGVEGGVFAGENMTYSVTIPEEHYERVLAGQAPFPDPGNLSTLPNGSSVLLRSEDFAGHEVAGSYGAFGIGTDHTNAQGTAVGLQVNDGNVRVLAGPTEAVTNGVELGLGGAIGPDQFQIGAELTLGGSTTLRNSELAFADISSASGQAAYEDFLRTGNVPAAGTTGVGTAGTIRQVDINSQASVGGSIQVGPLEVGGTLLEGRAVNGTHTEVSYNDGSREVSGLIEEGGVSTFANATYDPSGRETSRESGLLLDAVDSSYGGSLGAAFGEPTQDIAYDAQLQFSPQQYGQLRDRAIDGLADSGLYSDEQIQALRDGPDANGNFPGFDPFTGNPVTDQLLNHTNVDDFLNSPAIRFGGPTTVADGLVRIWAGTQDQGPLPGSLDVYNNDRS